MIEKAVLFGAVAEIFFQKSIDFRNRKWYYYIEEKNSAPVSRKGRERKRRAALPVR